MDRILRAATDDGMVKLSAVMSTDLTERARQIHGLSPTAAAALGRALSGASMLGDMMKEEDSSLTLRISGGGPIGNIVVVSDEEGCVRGYVSHPEADLPLKANGHLDVGGIVGKAGSLTVSRDIGLKTPYVGSTALVSGEIAEDLTAYLVESEQVPSACGLGVLVGTGGSVRAAGGFIVQLMPGASEELITKLEDNITFMDQLTVILDEDGLEEVVRQVLKDLPYEMLGEHPVSYRCYCSRERVSEALSSISPDDLKEMAESGEETEVCCQFCDRKYVFAPEELKALINR